MSEKKAKDKSFLQPKSLKITPAKKKKGRKRKSEEEESGNQEKRKQAMAELLVFILATLDIVFERKTC